MKKKLIIFDCIILIMMFVIPIIPFSTLLFTDAQVVRLYPYNSYLLDDNATKDSFNDYLADKGWTFSRQIEGGSYYSNGDKEQFIFNSQIISMYFEKSDIGFWNHMMTVLRFPQYLLHIGYIALGLILTSLSVMTFKQLKPHN